MIRTARVASRDGRCAGSSAGLPDPRAWVQWARSWPRTEPGAERPFERETGGSDMTKTHLPAIVGHVDDATVPWMDGGDHRYKLLRAERASGLRVLRVQLPAGFRAPRHRHTADT